jgi:hypothetical protein
MEIHKRNKYGLKDCKHTYLGGYQQWSDTPITLQEAKNKVAEDNKLYPKYKFIVRKMKGFYRIYYKLFNSEGVII